MAENRKQIPWKIQKILYAQSGGLCAMPDCNIPIIVTQDREKSNISSLAHIEAYKPDGARFNPNLTEDERNSEENLMVVCNNCHKKIDDFPEIYTVEKLKKIKQNHISKINLLKENMINFDFDDLIYASKNIIENQSDTINHMEFNIEEVNYDIKPIEHKLIKNNLTYPSKNLIVSALTQQEMVVVFISDMMKEDESFAIKLKDRLKNTYNYLKKSYSGDTLLFELYSQFKNNLTNREQAACLAIIVYFFTICELFEK